ncbi:hypothetical protein YC2023_082999 [Brassica napus]
MANSRGFFSDLKSGKCSSVKDVAQTQTQRRCVFNTLLNEQGIIEWYWSSSNVVFLDALEIQIYWCLILTGKSRKYRPAHRYLHRRTYIVGHKVEWHSHKFSVDTSLIRVLRSRNMSASKKWHFINLELEIVVFEKISLAVVNMNKDTNNVVNMKIPHV